MKSSTLTKKENSLEFQSPLDTPMLLFEGGKLIATGSDFVDTWVKVQQTGFGHKYNTQNEFV